MPIAISTPAPPACSLSRAGAAHAKSDPRHHGRDAGDLPLADALAEDARADPQEHDQAHRERRLDERQRYQQERPDLRRPPQQGKPRPDQPARPPDQASKQRDAQMLLCRSLTGLQSLQSDRGRIEDRGREGEREAGDDIHEQGAR